MSIVGGANSQNACAAEQSFLGARSMSARRRDRVRELSSALRSSPIASNVSPSSTLSRACVRACARACAVRVPVRVPVRVFVRVRVSGMRSRGMRWRGSNEGGGDEGGGGGLWQRRARLGTLGSIELARNRRTTFACNFNNITASQLVESRSAERCQKQCSAAASSQEGTDGERHGESKKTSAVHLNALPNILGDVADRCEHKMEVDMCSPATACHKFMHSVPQRRESTAVNCKEMLSAREIRTGWRGARWFKVASGTFEVLQQPQVVLLSRARW